MRALISVYDKTGIEKLAKELVDLGFVIVSTGGTARYLAENGIGVMDVSEVTGFPEIMDGRVKTLHPKVHGGILARRENEDDMRTLENLSIKPVDMVVVNLYPFKETVSKGNVAIEEAVENIDIGGPSMIRAAAKNFKDVIVLTDPTDYNWVTDDIKKGGISLEKRMYLARKAFALTAYYDSLIADYFRGLTGEKYTERLTLAYDLKQNLRYGENPHQTAAFYEKPIKTGASITSSEILWGKELSYNNIGDAEAAMKAVMEFDEPACVALKHQNPCGAGIGVDLMEAYTKAYEADPVSIFGGIVAFNRTVTLDVAEKLGELFLEVVIAPDYEDEALKKLKEKKNLRIIKTETMVDRGDSIEFKSVRDGLLIQDEDNGLYSNIQVVTKASPTDEELKDLLFAWKVVKHIKSNGIVLAKGGQTTGIGPGQVSRIWAAENAIRQAGDRAKGSVMASDAFFPFSDVVEEAAKAGIKAIIQPGGSIRDESSIDACDRYGISMVFTGMRHFKH
ncbi:bifunctional phosphoribosylaminoimidazolecarboxamide formyltransferase/IMP cyclohydrolase [Calorimonas adulescens]|uniref:Bifunctional purine biosynthesis protein PurH n=1 Tax=Calorimonas adulescens TaxID=2606906 RepID=A0A5D8QFD8_9THEO|nr:bifunctional phosphoribosylaminoimidazolecarboxamide formyltransferase/IMP cyclohydrolase [Calorimonas adulescens]TZE82546.1 bifunctional phosphoribosylaminoimidazolecarboxamide formyltransferase/IMP cyclohydrolase [Calorimonas adulescens]